MHRFYANEGKITDDEQKHLSRVLRLQVGDQIELMQPDGLYSARIDRIEKEQSFCTELTPLPSREAKMRITLYMGLLKGEKMDWVVQKATELGVHALFPVRMTRSIAQSGKAERWQRIAAEAAKQCGRDFPPTIHEPIDFNKALPLFAAHDNFLMPYEEGGAAMAKSHLSADVGLLIGPEGGIAAEEAGQVTLAGGIALTLGPRILRAETAAVAALSAMMHLGGEWECAL